MAENIEENINLGTIGRGFSGVFIGFIAIGLVAFQVVFGIDQLFTLGTHETAGQNATTIERIDTSVDVVVSDTTITDRFNRASSNEWVSEWGNFSIVPFNNNRVWASVGSSETYRTGSEAWGDFETELNFYIADFSDGSLNFKLRRPSNEPCGHYNLSVSSDFLQLTRQATNCAVVETLYGQDLSLATGEWHSLSLQFEGNSLRFQLNDEPAQQINGLIYREGGLGILTFETGTVMIDDVFTNVVN